MHGLGLGEFVRRMPKVELHVHLEGSISPATLLGLARKHGIELPADDETGVRRWYSFRDFEHFVEVYLTCSSCLRDGEDFHRLAMDFVAQQADQNVAYTEAHFSIGTHLANGGDGRGILQALSDAAREGERRFGVRLRYIFDVVRNVGLEGADTTLEWALAGKRNGVVALGLSGSEARFASEPFAGHFEIARQEGLATVAHAGEHAGPDSVRAVLDACRAQRIGHGVRAVEDPELVGELARRAVPLEVCPTSNLRLRVVERAEDHPFDRLYRAGLQLTVNSDDPPFFDTALWREYELLGETFGYGANELAGLALNGLRHSFLPADDKRRLEDDFRRQYRQLGEELLGVAVSPHPPGR